MKQSRNNFLMPLLDSNINRCKTILEKSIQINISLLVLTYNININELMISYLCICCRLICFLGQSVLNLGQFVLT